MLGEFAVVLLLVVINGLFAGAEIAIVSVERARIRQLVEEGSRAARAVSSLRKDPEGFFATVQVVITVVSAGAGAFGGATFATHLSPLLEPSLGRYAEEVALVLVVGVISYLSLVLGELVPKSLALRNATSYALLVAPLLLRLSSVVKPLVWLLKTSSNSVLRVFGDEATFAESRLSPNDLRDLVDEAAQAGSLDAHVGKIASRVLDLVELTAAKVMVPRTKIVGIPRGASSTQIRDVVLESPHSRLPVYDGDLDNVVGYIFYKDLVPLAWAGALLVLEDLLRPAYFVVASLPAAELLQQMRERRTHLAFVVDESGGLLGIVTLDDLVEELVGEVFGEMHHAVPASMHRDADGSVVALAEVTVRELNREFGLELPESADWSTLGGLSLNLAGRVPRTGDRLTLEDGAILRIEEATERTVTRVRIVPPPTESTDPADSAAAS